VTRTTVCTTRNATSTKPFKFKLAVATLNLKPDDGSASRLVLNSRHQLYDAPAQQHVTMNWQLRTASEKERVRARLAEDQLCLAIRQTRTLPPAANPQEFLHFVSMKTCPHKQGLGLEKDAQPHMTANLQEPSSRAPDGSG